jgi:hypothetical protein
MASFSFNFEDEDIEHDPDAMDVTAGNARSTASQVVEPASIPPQKHTLQQLVGTQPLCDSLTSHCDYCNYLIIAHKFSSSLTE